MGEFIHRAHIDENARRSGAGSGRRVAENRREKGEKVRDERKAAAWPLRSLRSLREYIADLARGFGAETDAQGRR